MDVLMAKTLTNCLPPLPLAILPWIACKPVIFVLCKVFAFSRPAACIDHDKASCVAYAAMQGASQFLPLELVYESRRRCGHVCPDTPTRRSHPKLCIQRSILLILLLLSRFSYSPLLLPCRSATGTIERRAGFCLRGSIKRNCVCML